jgi:hypothetical protein
MSIIKTDLRNKMGNEWLNDLWYAIVIKSYLDWLILKRSKSIFKRWNHVVCSCLEKWWYALFSSKLKWELIISRSMYIWQINYLYANMCRFKLLPRMNNGCHRHMSSLSFVIWLFTFWYG